MKALFKTIIISGSASLFMAFAILPANAVICLDHSYTTTGSGAGSDAEIDAKRQWVDAVKTDAGKHWAVLNNAKSPNLSCKVKDPSIALRNCTFTATPCQGSLGKAELRGLPQFRTR